MSRSPHIAPFVANPSIPLLAYVEPLTPAQWEHWAGSYGERFADHFEAGDAAAGLTATASRHARPGRVARGAAQAMRHATECGYVTTGAE